MLHTIRSIIIFIQKIEVICCGRAAELKLLSCKLAKNLAQRKNLSVKDLKMQNGS